MMASPTLVTPKSNPKPLLPHISIRSKLSTAASSAPVINRSPPTLLRRRDLASTALLLLSPVSAVTSAPSAAQASDDEYVKEAVEVINKVRSTITMDRNDPNVATAVAELRDASNSWVAKYRREKSLLGKPSFRDIYSALNAVSGHYISFGPTAPIPAKRKARILEEMDSAEKALQRGR